jgi:membrane-associated phospholipid phosphatase
MRSALMAHWRRKATLSIVLTLAFCCPYFLLQHLVLFPVRHLPLSPLDLAVEFNPHWVWVYQSVYLLVSIVPWFASSIEELDRYARGFLLQAYLGFAVFLFFPIAGPRPEVASGDPMFRFLLLYDSTLNSFPSLHIGLAVYTVLVAARLSNGRLPSTERLVAVAMASFWCGEIAYSAVATKQHYVIDLPAGAVLALLCYQWSWSYQPVRSAKTASPALPLRRA